MKRDQVPPPRKLSPLEAQRLALLKADVDSYRTQVPFDEKHGLMGKKLPFSNWASSDDLPRRRFVLHVRLLMTWMCESDALEILTATYTDCVAEMLAHGWRAPHQMPTILAPAHQCPTCRS